MVEERVTDGRRIAELLASELTGLAVGPLAEVDVVDAEPDATPSEEGTLAYRIAYAGTTIGSVAVFPDYAQVKLDEGPTEVSEGRPWESLAAVEAAGDGHTFHIESGRAVKAGVDAIERVVGGDI
jgi:hypothetical protein